MEEPDREGPLLDEPGPRGFQRAASGHVPLNKKILLPRPGFISRLVNTLGDEDEADARSMVKLIFSRN
jgi:hypothetical protein